MAARTGLSSTQYKKLTRQLQLVAGLVDE